MDDKFPVWNINNNEFTLDLQDLNDVEKYTNACDVLSKQEKSFDKNAARQVQIKAYCKMYYDFYDTLFGEGTSQKIFEGRINARICDIVFADFIKYIEATHSYNAKISGDTAALLSKYISR